MTGFTDIFGGSTVQPAQVSYRAVALAANAALSWPNVATDQNFLARIMDVTAAAGPFALLLPDARGGGDGFDAIFLNPGANSYTVQTNTGVTVCTVPPGVAQYVFLSDNSTQSGTWKTLQFASLASAVVAASLVGPGIGASGSSLFTKLSIALTSANYLVLPGDRAKLFAWTAGAGTITFSSASALGTDFYCAVTNQGSGGLTLAANAGEHIDGASNLTLAPGESCFIGSSGATDIYTIGRGRSTQFNFTLLSKAVTTGTVTLTLTEAQNVVQKYTGALVGNVTVVLPPTVQVYYASNQTTGAFGLTFKSPAVGSTVSVPQNQNAILFCDGTNVINTSTTIAGLTSLTLNGGSAAGPALNFTGDVTSGIFQRTAGAVDVSISGTQIAEFAGGTGVKLTLNSGAALVLPGEVPIGLFVGSDVASAGATIVARRSTATGAATANVALLKSAGTGTIPTTVANGDQLGSVYARGHDGTNYILSGQITFGVDNAVSAGIVPGRIIFSLADAVGGFQERARFDSAGRFGIGTNAPASAVHSKFDGSVVNGLTIEDTAAGGTPLLVVVKKNAVNMAVLDSTGSVSFGGQVVSGSAGALGGYGFAGPLNANPGVLDTYLEVGPIPGVVSFGGLVVGMTASASAFYTRIGDTVHFNLQGNFSAKGSSSGQLQIVMAALPASVRSFVYSAVFNTFTGITGAMNVQFAGTTFLFTMNSATDSVAVNQANVTNTSSWQISGSYHLH